MENFRFGVWMGISALFLLLSVNVTAQPGFLSIDCGAKTNHTARNNIRWVTDHDYIHVGQKAYTGDTSEEAFGSYMQYLRGFSAVPNFAYSIATRDILTVRNVSLEDDLRRGEKILVTSGRVLYLCLIRTSENDDPFINAIELRTLRDGMYPQAKPGTMLSLSSRYDLGANSSVIRYPLDQFDRLWNSDEELVASINPDFRQYIHYVNSEEPISTNNTQDLPPSVVMQTAWVIASNTSLEFFLNGSGGSNSLLLLYFAEIQPFNMSKRRSFNLSINDRQYAEPITLVPNYSASELPLQLNMTQYQLVLQRNFNPNYGPLINAFEYYVMVDTEPATELEDIEALDAIKTSFDIKGWISDPCYVINWDRIGCDKSSSVRRISEINLSGMNLTGLVPHNIGQLTALVNVSLDNNQLMGSLPNFSSLTMLERLHMQNNNLSGSLPEWLSEIKYLKELFIENNNFTGVIPVQLLDKPSLKLNYSLNHYLCIGMHRGKCILSNSRKDKASVVLGPAISGAVIMALVLAGIAVYRKKFRKRKCLSKECSMIMAPNPTMFSAFSLKDMIKATQNFGQKIGQGGFGSVFFGQLPGGKGIAVKVLSLFSKQGIHEFQNEVDLLSRVHHKNLVSLLGYCNESKELMLIYEHMSGGSLRNHLYGPKAGISELNWKTRLKIAFDAAQGLEYLHVGCTPKIIHRDVKTANILLDCNLKGKLADFGLSRMIIDGEATHVTTTVKGTAGYLDPEYFRTQMLTERSDVYSFGVVLLEIICGRPPINANLPEEELNLIQWVTPYVENESAGDITEVIDRRLGGNYDMKSITGIAKLALRCVDTKPSSRPSVSEVVAEIKEAIMHENENNAPLPNSEVIGIECGDLQANPVCSLVDVMEWGDNSSNLPHVGR